MQLAQCRLFCPGHQPFALLTGNGALRELLPKMETLDGLAARGLLGAGGWHGRKNAEGFLGSEWQEWRLAHRASCPWHCQFCKALRLEGAQQPHGQSLGCPSGQRGAPTGGTAAPGSWAAAVNGPQTPLETHTTGTCQLLLSACLTLSPYRWTVVPQHDAAAGGLGYSGGGTPVPSKFCSGGLLPEDAGGGLLLSPPEPPGCGAHSIAACGGPGFATLETHSHRSGASG